MKPRVYQHEAGCWHIQLGTDGKREPCFMEWWDAYHEALYIHSAAARKSRFLGGFYGGDA